MAERMARAREEEHRHAQAASEQEARELQARLDGERAAARASLAPLARDEWWEHAQPDDLARAWETASAWQAVDEDARRTAERMRDELRRRYGVDVENLAADPAAVRDALERREDERRRAAEERDRAAVERGDAGRLMADADRADRDQEADRADGAQEAAEVLYDSAERRGDLAATLEARGVDAETVEARVVADTNQARPPADAVAEGPRKAPAAKRARGRAGVKRSPTRRAERGR